MDSGLRQNEVPGIRLCPDIVEPSLLDLPSLCHREMFTVRSQSSRFYLIFLSLGTLRKPLKRLEAARGRRLKTILPNHR